MSPRRKPLDSRAALEEVRAVYAELARRPIGRRCTLLAECCRFKLTGRTPFLTLGEALLAARAFRATGRKQPPRPGDGSCPMLDPKTARCMIYESRPFGCRTHFCRAAGGPFERREVIDLIRRLEVVDAQLGGSGPRALPAAVESVI
jgi:Fe-S-cluster containining protein